MLRSALAVDVGGTNVRAALVSTEGRLGPAIRERLDDAHPEAVLAQIGRLGRRLEVSPEAPIGVGLAGQLTSATGHVAIAPNLGWRDVPFGAMLADEFGREVRLVNDLNAITLGEATIGAGAGDADVLCVFVGTGVGMGAMLGGRLHEGVDGLATELGHVKVRSPLTGRLCGCGARGCLEAYVGGAHLPALYLEQSLISRGVDWARRSASEGTFSACELERAFSDGDRAAREVWYEAAQLLALGIANAVTLFNPRVLVLGGGVLDSAPRLRAAVVEELRVTAGAAHVERLEIRTSALGDDAGLVGAGLAAWLDARRHRTSSRLAPERALAEALRPAPELEPMAASARIWTE